MISSDLMIKKSISREIHYFPTVARKLFCFLLLEKGEPLTIWGTGKPRRQFIYSLVILSIYCFEFTDFFNSGIHSSVYLTNIKHYLSQLIVIGIFMFPPLIYQVKLPFDLNASSILTHLFPTHPFSTVRFSDVFRSQRKGAVGANGLKVGKYLWQSVVNQNEKQRKIMFLFFSVISIVVFNLSCVMPFQCMLKL